MATWLFNKDECGDDYTVIDELTAENPSHEELNSIAQKIMSDNDYDCVYVGKGELVTADDIVPDFIGDDVLERIEDYAADNVAEELITTTAADRKLLNDRLYEVIVNWMEECKVLTKYYTIPNVMKYTKEDK